MSVQGVRRSNGYVPRYDALEILMIASGVVFIVAVALVFWRLRGDFCRLAPLLLNGVLWTQTRICCRSPSALAQS